MAKLPTIRIRENDRKEYARLAKNAKAKIRRTQKNYGVNLNNEIKIPDLEDFKSREEFNEWKQEASTFTNRNNRTYQYKKNDYGIVTSKRDIMQIERNVKKAQNISDQFNKEMAKKPFYEDGVQQGTVGQQMQKMRRPEAGINRPVDFDFNTVRTQKRLEQVRENMQKRADPEYIDKRMEIMKNNFINILSYSFNSEADEVIEMVQGISADTFYEVYHMMGEDDLDFKNFDSEGISADEMEQARESLETVKTYLENYYNGKLDMDMEGI